MAPILKTFEKRIKNTNINKNKNDNKTSSINILSYVDNGLITSQEKSFDLSCSSLVDSCYVISNLLKDAGLYIKHQKSEVFHFSRAHTAPLHSIDLTNAGGPILHPKPIWQYLGFYFDYKLFFYYYTHFYTTKCLSILKAMKMLGNSTRGLFSLQKHLLYYMCIMPIATYGFQLWFLKDTPIAFNIQELNKMQRRAIL